MQLGNNPGQSLANSVEYQVNYGKRQASYSLDWVSNDELALQKVSYKDEGKTLDKLYETDPENYIIYNIADVALTNRLHQKLKHVDLHNLLRRDMKSTLSVSLRGQSGLFSSFYTYELERTGKKMRWGMVQELTNSVSEQEIAAIPKPKEKSVKWTIKKVDDTTYQKTISRFPGAYVKDPLGKVIDNKSGLLIDLDASSLYPSMMRQHNISFDTYYGRIVDPVCYKLFGLLQKILGTNNNLPNGFHNDIFTLVRDYTERASPQNKNDFKQVMYYILMNCLIKLKQINKPLQQLLNPQTQQDLLVQKLYLIPTLDLTTTIHPQFHEVSTFSYHYMINKEVPPGLQKLLVYEEEYSPNARITTIDPNQFFNYLKEKGLLITIAGTLFYNHETKNGIINQFLVDRLSMRKKYKKKRGEYTPGTEEYKFYNQRQDSCKKNANSSYGVSGLSGFRFSNHHMAKSITLSGKLALKISQIVGEVYLEDKRQKVADKGD